MKKLDLEKSLFLYVSALSILSLIAWQATLIHGQFWGMNFTPYNTFLVNHIQHFDDFVMFDPAIKLWLNGGEFKVMSNYFPTTIYGMAFFHFIYPLEPVYAYLSMIFFSVCIAGFFLYYGLRYSPTAETFQAVIVITILTSYPFMFTMERANIEGLLWVLVLLGVLSFINNNFFTAGILFAIAASMKLYPAVFLLLLFSVKKYREFFVSIFIVVWISIIASYMMHGSVCDSVASTLDGISAFDNAYILIRRHPEWDHSLFFFIKQMVRFINFITLRDYQIDNHFTKVYAIGTVVCFFLLYFMIIVKMALINQVFCITILSIFLPFVSHDYTLIHLYIPWGLFMIFLAYDAESAGFTTKQALNILIPCAIIFTPQSYLIIEGIGGFGGQIKALVLLYLLIVVLKNPMPSNTLFKENYSKV